MKLHAKGQTNEKKTLQEGSIEDPNIIQYSIREIKFIKSARANLGKLLSLTAFCPYFLHR
jgi:hypothetical protein